MIKKILPLCIVFSLFIGSPLITSAKTTKKATTHHKKKEVLIANPPLITLDTAPHSPAPASKHKKKTTKKVGKKKS